VTDFYTNYKK